MKRLFVVPVLVLSLALLYVGCSKGGMMYTDTSDPVSMAGSLWGKMQGEKYRSTWKFWPGKTAFYKGQHPHGALLTTYVNDAAYRAIKNKSGVMPAGAIIVKENYMPNKMLGAITVMKKIDGYNPAAGDWFWVKFGPDGKPMTKEMNGKSMALAGKVGGCIGCHTGRVTNDFIFTGSLK